MISIRLLEANSEIRRYISNETRKQTRRAFEEEVDEAPSVSPLHKRTPNSINLIQMLLLPTARRSVYVGKWKQRGRDAMKMQETTDGTDKANPITCGKHLDLRNTLAEKHLGLASRQVPSRMRDPSHF
ncbi:unnamed protein product [Nippostrongylus brasiliensis]|uniref:Uncharacterized protein n=1 Tax=Nippostrongylus brasiliensis TaxID=27835 RepID=A0A0N4Y167_NIPBR|nr:unnamed protein product [Nippostrongylus brasiliensis]